MERTTKNSGDKSSASTLICKDPICLVIGILRTSHNDTSCYNSMKPRRTSNMPDFSTNEANFDDFHHHQESPNAPPRRETHRRHATDPRTPQQDAPRSARNTPSRPTDRPHQSGHPLNKKELRSHAHCNALFQPRTSTFFAPTKEKSTSLRSSKFCLFL